MSSAPLYLPAMSVVTCLGAGKADHAASLFAGSRGGLQANDGVPVARGKPVGTVTVELPSLPNDMDDLDSRNNRILALLVSEIAEELHNAVARHGADRIAVVLGTSTSGIAEGEAALADHARHGAWPDGYRFTRQETGSPAAFVARLLGLSGPAYVVATACSSSAKVFASARRLIRAGLADAAVVGGADSLCGLTIAGFSALESLSGQACNPFSANRDGITIGEGGALFLLTREPAPIALLGVGESSDAHHISAPDPEGHGAMLAMRAALDDAGVGAEDIGYINLHGTATRLNDAMESKAVHALFGSSTPCSSTKAMTGHTLGAAGAVEAAFVWLTLSHEWNKNGLLPPQLWDGAVDPDLAPIALTAPGARLIANGRATALSNSFAFGGNNCSLVLGRGWQ
jgi:3-oxoacyl-[acyl-carrier-protein] synthase-1